MQGLVLQINSGVHTQDAWGPQNGVKGQWKKRKSPEGKERKGDRMGYKHFVRGSLTKACAHTAKPFWEPRRETSLSICTYLGEQTCSSTASGTEKRSQNRGCQCYDKKQTLWNSTHKKSLKWPNKNARLWELSGLVWLFTFLRVSFDRGKTQRKCVPAFTENIWELTWGNLLSLN